MGQKKYRDQSNRIAPSIRGNGQREETDKDTPTSLPGQATFDRALRHVANGDYQKALDLLHSARREPRMRNVVGVCLMRMGRTEDALRIFRDLVLAPGCVVLKPETPLIHKINYATSLLLAGQVLGCLDVLAELGDDRRPSVQRLRSVIKDWERSLSFWQRLNWRFGRCEPKHVSVTLDSPPGEFDVELPSPTNQRPDTPDADG